jgi:hypothetical protein
VPRWSRSRQHLAGQWHLGVLLIVIIQDIESLRLDLRMDWSPEDSLDLFVEVEAAEGVFFERHLVVSVEHVAPFLLGARLDGAG